MGWQALVFLNALMHSLHVLECAQPTSVAAPLLPTSNHTLASLLPAPHPASIPGAGVQDAPEEALQAQERPQAGANQVHGHKGQRLNAGACVDSIW